MQSEKNAQKDKGSKPKVVIQKEESSSDDIFSNSNEEETKGKRRNDKGEKSSKPYKKAKGTGKGKKPEGDRILS